jgi:hypothetical protein
LAFTEIGCIVVSGRAAGADAEAAGADAAGATCAHALVFNMPKPAAKAPSGNSRFEAAAGLLAPVAVVHVVRGWDWAEFLVWRGTWLSSRGGARAGNGGLVRRAWDGTG